MGLWFILFTCFFILGNGRNFNPYKVLEISRKATASEIKRAYRSLARRFHPDKASNAQRASFEQRMKEINEAYEVLTDNSQKVKVDQSLSEFVRFTHENFKYIARKENIWIIFIHSHWCRDCLKAKEVMQKVCAHFEGMIKCGSISSDSELQLTRELGVRKVPSILFRAAGNTYDIPFLRHKTDPSSVIKSVSQRFPTGLKELKKLKYVQSFLQKSRERLKAVFVSQTRSNPHILHRWLAHQFRDHVMFCFLPLKNFHSSEIDQLKEIIGEKLDVPMLALFEGPDLLPTVIDLTSDPEQMFYRLDSTFKRVPRIPELQATEYYSRCYTNMEDSLFDSSKICILLLLSNPSLWAKYQTKLVPIAEDHDATQFIWVDCKKQKVFCNEWKQGSPSSRLFQKETTLRIVGVRGPQNIHSLSPILTKHPDNLDREDISNWVSKFVNNDPEIYMQHGLCTLPQLKSGSMLGSNFDLEDGWFQKLTSLGSSTVSTTSSAISQIINFLFTIFFLLVFLLVMCVMGGRGGGIQFRYL